MRKELTSFIKVSRKPIGTNIIVLISAVFFSLVFFILFFLTAPRSTFCHYDSWKIAVFTWDLVTGLGPKVKPNASIGFEMRMFQLSEQCVGC